MDMIQNKDYDVYTYCNNIHFIENHMSRVMRKPTFCICENKGADQLCSNCTADQRLCFRYRDSTILLLSKFLSSVAAQLGSCRICLETTFWFSHDVAQLWILSKKKSRLPYLLICLVSDNAF